MPRLRCLAGDRCPERDRILEHLGLLSDLLLPLRADMKAKLTVPANITKIETIRLANFVRALAVDVGDES